MTATLTRPTAQPVWLLDVDGVLNAARPAWSEQPHHGIARDIDNNVDFKIRWAPSLIERIRIMHAWNRVEIRWCTTWCDTIQEIEQLLKLGPFPRAAISSQSWPAVYDDKLKAAFEVLKGECRPLIWTDDDMIPDNNSPEGVLLRKTSTPFLLISPDCDKGLEPVHLTMIDNFLNEHAGLPTS